MIIKNVVVLVLVLLLLLPLSISENHEGAPVFESDTSLDFETDFSPGTTEGIVELIQSDPDKAMELLAGQPALVHSDPILRDVVEERIVDPSTACDDSNCHTVRGELFGGQESEENGGTISKSQDTRTSFSEHVEVEHDVDLDLQDSGVSEYDREEGRIRFDGGPEIKLDEFQKSKGVRKVKATSGGKVTITEVDQTPPDEEPDVEEDVPVEEEDVAEELIPKEDGLVETTFSGDMEISRSPDVNGYFVTVDDASIVLPFGGYDRVSVRKTGESKVAVDGLVVGGHALIRGGIVIFDNHRGTIEFNADGDVTAFDATAEFIQSSIEKPDEEHTAIADGRFRKVGSEYQLEPMEDGETSFTSIHGDDAISVRTDGVDVVVYNGKKTDSSPYVTGKPLGGSFPSDMGQVWISDDARSISAKGIVTVFEETVVAGNPIGKSSLRPSFTGLEESAEYHAEKDLLGRSKFVMRGKAHYEDYSKDVVSSEGAFVEQKISDSSETAESISVRCTGCTSGTEAAVVGMKLAGGKVIEEQQFVHPVTGERQDFYVVSPEKEQDMTLHVTYTVDDTGKLTPSFSASELGRIAKQDQIVKRADISIESNDGLVAFEGGTLGIYERDGDGDFNPVTLDIGIRDVIGGKVFVLDDQQKQAVGKFMTSYQDGQLSELFMFSPEGSYDDPKVQATIKEATGIDVGLMMYDTEYANRIWEGTKVLQDDVVQIRDSLDGYGFFFDESGSCFEPADCYEKLEEHRQLNERPYTLYLQLQEKTQEGQKQFLAAGKILAETARQDTEGFDQSLAILSMEQAVLEPQIYQREVVRVMSGDLTPQEKDAILVASEWGKQLQEQQQDVTIAERRLAQISQELRQMRLSSKMGLPSSIPPEDLENDFTYTLLVEAERRHTRSVSLVRESQEKQKAKVERFLLSHEGSPILPEIYSSLGRSETIQTAEGFTRIDDKAVGAEFKLQQLELLQEASFPVSINTIDEAKGRTAIRLVDAGRYAEAAALVEGVDDTVPGVAYVKSSKTCYLDGFCAAEIAKAERATSIVRAQWEIEREEQDSLVTKGARELGLVSVVSLGALAHNLVADTEIPIPPEAGEGIFVTPIKTVRGGISYISGDSKSDKLQKEVEYNQEILQGIEETQEEIANGVSFEDLSPNIYSQSAQFSCKSRGIDCQQADFEKLKYIADFEDGGTSQVFEEMQHLAAQGNSDADGWVEDNKAGVAISRVGSGVETTLEILLPFAIMGKSSKISQVGKLYELESALATNNLIKFEKVANAGLLGVKAPGKVRKLTSTLAARIAPEGSVLQRTAARTGEFLTTPLLSRSKVGYKQVLAAEEAAERAALQESVLTRLDTLSKTAKSSDEIADIERALQTIGLTRDTIGGAATKASQAARATETAAIAKISSFPGWEDELAKVENRPLSLSESEVMKADDMFESALKPRVQDLPPDTIPTVSRFSTVDDISVISSRQQAKAIAKPVTDLLEENGVHYVFSGSVAKADEMTEFARLGLSDDVAGDIDILLSSTQAEKTHTLLTKLSQEGRLREIGVIEYKPLVYQSRTDPRGVTYGSSAKGSVILEDGRELDLIAGFRYEIDEAWALERGYTIEGSTITVEGYALPIERIPGSSGATRYRVTAFDLDEAGNPLVDDFFRTSDEGMTIMTDDALRVKYGIENRPERTSLLEELAKGSSPPIKSGVPFSAAEISQVSPVQASKGLQSQQYNLEEIVTKWDDLGPLSKDVISTHPIYRRRNPITGEEVLIKGGPEHTTRADYVGQRILALGGHPTPKTSLALENGEVRQVLEFFDDFASSQTMPIAIRADESLQGAFVYDSLIGNYDRAAWNMMYKDDAFVFIDQGASLGSSATGRYRALHDIVTQDELKVILTNPQFGGKINPAYANLVEITPEGRLFIRNPTVVEDGIRQLRSITDHQIDAIVSDAFRFDSLSKQQADLAKRIEALQAQPTAEAQDALEVATRIRLEFGGSEEAYMKYALKTRRDSLSDVLEGTLHESRPELQVRSRAVLLDETEQIYSLDGQLYKFDPERGWLGKSDDTFTRPVPQPGEESIYYQLQAESMGVPVPLLERSRQKTLATLERFDSKDAGLAIDPARIEQDVLEIAHEIGYSVPLSREKILDLSVIRARAIGMDEGEIATFIKRYNYLYDETTKKSIDIPKMIEVLGEFDELDPGFTTVHFLRDGLHLGAAHELRTTLGSGISKVRTSYVSRDTTTIAEFTQSDRMRTMMGVAQDELESSLRSVGIEIPFETITRSELETIITRRGLTISTYEKEYNKIVLRQFNDLYEKSADFRSAVDRTYKQMVAEGLTQEKRLRLVDTCCSGTINSFVASTINKFHPEIEIQNILMGSTFRHTNLALSGGIVEDVVVPFKFKGFDVDTGLPILQRKRTLGNRIEGADSNRGGAGLGEQEEILRAYMDQLIILEKTQKATVIQ
ncbi:hypothetical protein HOL21_02310 [Candidatus Woesearchaeota archaeon]|jgi:hypothetical protein|nr:hypothetical protein [Candidatus Woesearchaeota archaeon]MBT5397024.1 hypothetical protein [Candidatus Woesearchaeota archaeon]MBT5924557.1 hypothetical protein [Candidatus Woesearchaeota archaeon]MBT6367430.1 hypothetical protein [Candidatus Woesearchaeota archaeon]MBT7762424.1 hypothetical protein [Candidatus Woesearchaeota archaeon]